MAMGGGAEPRIVRAPGRVNLIGEHTDYNDGFVLPLAIDRSIEIEFQPQPPGLAATVELTLASTGERRSIDIGPGASPTGDWTDYVAGTAWALREAGAAIRGFRGVLRSNLPIGHGLSSSAAFELAAAWALAGGEAPMADSMRLAAACRRAENEFVGVPCGPMDQFAVTFGVAGAALLLDCRSMDHRAVALPERAAVLVVDSGQARDLRTSAYAERRDDCARAVGALGGLDPSVRSLRDATPALLAAAEGRLDQIAFRRARHVLSENDRVLAAVAALEAGDLAAVGRELLASHASLRDDFEVSTEQLDELVEVAAATPGVYGAKLTGAGFGGSVVVLADAERAAVVAATIAAAYRTPAGDQPEIMPVRASAGAGQTARSRVGAAVPAR